MGKRSDFERVPRDFYPTPREAVVPLVPHLPDDFTYWEPCGGDHALASHLSELTCGSAYPAWVTDIKPSHAIVYKLDALSDPYEHLEDFGLCDYIITNPPWDRKILHQLIPHFSAMRPTWLLFDADWMHTKQSAQFMPWLAKIVSVGRVKWIPDSKMTGKDNCAWYLFDQKHAGKTEFVGRTT